MTLTAPPRLRGRMSRWTPEDLRQKRLAWMLARGAEGHTMPAIADALGISPETVWAQMTEAGHRWHDQPRKIRWAGNQAGNKGKRA